MQGGEEDVEFRQVGALAGLLLLDGFDDGGEAARVLETCGDLQRAAELYYKVGQKELAAKLWRETNNPLESARCYSELGHYKAAGELLETAEHLYEAAETYEKDESCLETSAAIFCKVLHLQK